MIKVIICILFSLLSLTGCAKNEIAFKNDGNKIVVHYEEDTITTVTFTAEYPLGEVHDAGKIRDDYMKVLNDTYGEKAVKDVNITIHDNKVDSITVLDFRTIKDLSKFGIKSPYPSLKEFTDFLKRSGWNTVDK